MKEKDKEATLHLQKTREYAQWAKKDREEQVPELTPEQRAQMRRYIMQEKRKREKGWKRLNYEE